MDATAINRQQLGDLMAALEGVVVKRADLVAFSDGLERAMPELVRKNMPLEPRPVVIVFDVIRDPRTDLIIQIICTTRRDLTL